MKNEEIVRNIRIVIDDGRERAPRSNKLESVFRKKGLFDVYKVMMEKTIFLPQKTSIHERLYCIQNDVKEKPKCYCGTFLKFSIKDGIYRYRKHCGNSMCRSKHCNSIDENGLTMAQKRAKKIIKSKLNNIDKNGLNSFERSSIKCKKTKIKDVVDGLNNYQRASRKAVVTRIKNGSFHKRTTYGRVECKPFNNKLHYQGLAEKRFLTKIESFGLIDRFVHGEPVLYYIKNKPHKYYPDFQIDNIIFEVKSVWTYDRRGLDLNFRMCNNLKWKATLESGKKLYIYWDNNNFQEVLLKDLTDIKNDLFCLKNKIGFSSENLLKIIS